MTIQYDDKGKFYTEVVPKESIPVTIQTSIHKIDGIIFARPGERLKDEMNQMEKFIAISDAKIYDLSANLENELPFMIVNIETIIWIAPQNAQGER